MEWFYRTESKEYSSKRPQGLKLSQLMQREGKTFVKICTSASVLPFCISYREGGRLRFHNHETTVELLSCSGPP